MKKIQIYDTTLRDGSQGEDISFSVDDKLHIARKLDELGIDYIEGGWPGSNFKDMAFFKRVSELGLKHARVAAFGSTAHPKNSKVEDDNNIQALIESGTPVVTIFGKSWDLHVKVALGISLERNLELIGDSVAYLRSLGKEVIYDAEHFFDGLKADREYALATLKAAEQAGAGTIVLCDTNGGTLTEEIRDCLRSAVERLKTPIGIHTHNDSDMAVANSVIAIRHGAVHVQGTFNSYGERCGNANLCSIIPNIELKLGMRAIGQEKLRNLTEVSHYVSEIANMHHRQDFPFVGKSAFAHKGGIHVSAVMKEPLAYEHIPPETVGNERRVLISELSGKSNVLYKAERMGLQLDKASPGAQAVVNKLKEMEHYGYQFEGAEASFEILFNKLMNEHSEFFDLDGFRVITERKGSNSSTSEAVIKLRVDGTEEHTAAEGVGPVSALDHALRKSLTTFFPCIKDIRLTDYKVRVLNAKGATDAKVRVLIETSDGHESWGTVGVSENLIEASWLALVDSITYKLKKEYGFKNKEARERVKG
ncbi:MAG: citramalate synthase [Acidobacteria bacterium]|nr:citramalate synthase [Acidobacteriota bacterium]MCI0720113.1 citramalate synthase [Acidobacteriota bacterium]